MKEDIQNRPTSSKSDYRTWKLTPYQTYHHSQNYPDKQVNDLAIKAYKRPNTSSGMSRREHNKQESHRPKFDLGSVNDELNSMNMSCIEKKKYSDRPLTSCANMLGSLYHPHKKVDSYCYELGLRRYG